MTCTQCGAQNPDNGAFCVGCGQPLAAQQASPLPPQYAAPEAAPADNEAQDAQDNKVMGILAYIGILVLVPIFAAKESAFAKFHANQGVVLWIAAIAGNIVFAILGAILGLLHLAFIGSILTGVFGLAILVFVVLGIMNAAKGEKKELPLIGGIKILK